MVTKIEEKVYPFKNQSEGVDDDIKIELSVCDEAFNVSIKENDRELYERSAIRITKCYNSYLEHYKSRPIEAIERMTLLDICLHRMEWRHINYMNYLISF